MDAHGDRATSSEEPLDAWQRNVLTALLSVEGPPEGPPSAVLRESIPHLVVTSRCGCGCLSFFVRDSRKPRCPGEAGALEYSSASTSAGVEMCLLVREEAPWSVDVVVPDAARATPVVVDELVIEAATSETAASEAQLRS